ncbi:MAG: Uma2 family endonuclease [Planctomycetes bacterium]|nr:Uma2 family endonuclease [Planctomycetota bacterium]
MPAPEFLEGAGFRRFTINEYHQMIRDGILIDGEAVELLEGWMVKKMSRGTPHDAVVQALFKRLLRLAPTGWDVRGQSAVTLGGDSEPESDFTFVKGDESAYRDRHPGPADIGLVVEVSSSSLRVDRTGKGRIYAHNGIPVYWVVNVVDKVIEVYTQPTDTSPAAAYATRNDYPVGTAAPVVLDGNTVGTITVAEVFG